MAVITVNPVLKASPDGIPITFKHLKEDPVMIHQDTGDTISDVVLLRHIQNV